MNIDVKLKDWRERTDESNCIKQTSIEHLKKDDRELD